VTRDDNLLFRCKSEELREIIFHVREGHRPRSRL
jgi:hypothetical protein